MGVSHAFTYFQERERDYFSQFITEGFTSYCKRKRRNKVLLLLYWFDLILLMLPNNSLIYSGEYLKTFIGGNF